MVRTGTLPRDQWGGIETLSYRLLIPAVLIKSIALSELSMSEFGPMIFALVFALGLSGMIVLSLRWLRTQDDLPNPAFTTLFQTTTRWNAFIALAAAELFVGAEGVALIALSMAVLIPLINIVNIIVLAAFGTATASILSIVKMVLKNPLVQACAIGIMINLSDVFLPNFAIQTLDLVGRAALGVGILAVGAGVSPERLFKSSATMWFGIVFRVIFCPAIFLGAAHSFGLGQIEMIVGVLVLAVPAASNGYIVAKQMGGDADLYADILSWQTILSMITLPLFMVFLIS